MAGSHGKEDQLGKAMKKAVDALTAEIKKLKAKLKTGKTKPRRKR